tara:strand:+ start:145 stop:624 length:480 start_codon:yes stop_codon:yes gene_type:complete
MYFVNTANFNGDMHSFDIKNLRKFLKLSQTDFAQKLGVSLRTIQNYEKGSTAPSAESLLRLQKFSKQSIAENKSLEKSRAEETLSKEVEENKIHNSLRRLEKLLVLHHQKMDEHHGIFVSAFERIIKDNEEIKKDIQNLKITTEGTEASIAELKKLLKK